MTPFSCVVIGNESLLIGCSDLLLDRGHAIRAVVSKDPAIAEWAERKGLLLCDRLDALEALPEDGFDWLFSIANLSLIPEDVLARPARGTVNFHDGPLPRYAGLNAPVWAILNGETEYGVSWHMVEGGIDEGDLVAQKMFDIAPDETAFSLNSKCYAAALESFGTLLGDLEAGAPRRVAQDLSRRSYFARTRRPDNASFMDFDKPAADIVRLVRALDFGDYWNPLALPKIMLNDRIVLVRSAVPAEASGTPGSVLTGGAEGLTVAAGAGSVILSGLTDLAGTPVETTELAMAEGTVLTRPDVDSGAMRRAADGDGFWRGRLQVARPVALTLARRGGTPDWQARDLGCTLSRADALAAILAWALTSTAEDAAAIAFATPDLGDDLGLVSRWVPMHIDGTTPFAQVRAQIEAKLARIARHGGFANDIFARDPALGMPEMPDIAVTTGDTPVAGAAISITLGDDGGLQLHHDRARLDDAAADLMADRLAHMMAHVATGPVGPAAGFATLPEAERKLTLETWNETKTPLSGPETIPAMFEAQVAATPDATALVFEDESLSYAELNARANRIARVLGDMGVAPGAHVGLFLPRSVDLLAGALGILKAGGAYVPLDPAYPPDRIAHYLSDSGAQVVVTAERMTAGLPETQAAVLEVDRDPRIAAAATDNPETGPGAGDLAYLIYTSGSTGLPKGVMVEHGNVANFFAGMDAYIDRDAGSVWLAVTSLAFDISVLELFYTLARGFKVVMTSDESRAVMSNGPMTMPGRKVDFNLFYWGNDDGAGRDKYKLLLEGAQFADAHGFNAVWTPERHFHAFGGPYPNPSVTGAAVAAVTRNLSVRAGSCVAPLHHPARIAEDWAVIDNLTNGRAGLAIASGWQPDDFVLRPENTPPNNKPAMYDAIDKLRALWRGEAVAFPTAGGGTHAVITQPRPVSAELPIWVTTAGNPDTWREAGEIGANVLTHLLGQTIEEVAGKIRIYHAALRKAGHDPADFKVSLMLHTYLSDSRDHAREIARGPMKDYLRSAAGLIKQYAWAFPAFKRPKGVKNAFDMDLNGLTADELEAILDFAFERYFEDAGLFGTIDDGVARAEQLKRIGVDEICCLIDYGIAPAEVLAGLHPLAEVLRLANAPSELDADDFSVAAQMLRHGVTHLQCTPSMARMIADDDGARLGLAGLSQLMVGGEALPGALASDLTAATGGQVLNMYGPTETTIWSTVAKVGQSDAATIGVGGPIANTSVYVLDAGGTPQPVGVPGELHIGGLGVTRGYWQREALSAERFVPDPFGGGRMYRTGDLVAWDAQGGLCFLGRTDHQVKIRGQRIELGEIEARIEAQPAIRQAVVVARDVKPGDTRLVAYVTASGPVDAAQLRAALAQVLPEVMVPAHVVTLSAFPLTPNKKVDRKALPDPATTREDAAPRPEARPGNDTEQAIAAIWSRILGVSDVRADDNFFALGGHSLLAVQAHREIKAELNAERLSITDIFRFPTLRGLAGHLGGAPAKPDLPEVSAPARAETMSKRRAMRSQRGARV
ncbi:MAG: LLM class flavin-dependent oxidoreductase [Rhodobacteraceae bacterium]|nr:LLM class flavin-dependent oxidoreductase [Paracoccaceae bacterium]